jgi:hypothetical protein
MQIPEVIKRHKGVTVLALALGLPILVFTLWATITLNYTYSSGERAGFLQKVSKRGWLCKTWEGELQMVAIPGAAPEVFKFTSRSDEVADQLNRLNGQRVVLHYEEHKGVPTSCFGDTDYFVTSVRLVGGK